jgi:hypothetical protein
MFLSNAPVGNEMLEYGFSYRRLLDASDSRLFSNLCELLSIFLRMLDKNIMRAVLETWNDKILSRFRPLSLHTFGSSAA